MRATGATTHAAYRPNQLNGAESREGILKLFLRQKHLSRQGRRLVTQALVRHAQRQLRPL